MSSAAKKIVNDLERGEIGTLLCVLWAHRWRAAHTDNSRGKIRLYCTRCAKFRTPWE